MHQANTDIEFLKAHDINAELSLTQDEIKYHFNFDDEESAQKYLKFSRELYDIKTQTEVVINKDGKFFIEFDQNDIKKITERQSELDEFKKHDFTTEEKPEISYLSKVLQKFAYKDYSKLDIYIVKLGDKSKSEEFLEKIENRYQINIRDKYDSESDQLKLSRDDIQKMIYHDARDSKISVENFDSTEQRTEQQTQKETDDKILFLKSGLNLATDVKFDKEKDVFVLTFPALSASKTALHASDMLDIIGIKNQITDSEITSSNELTPEDVLKRTSSIELSQEDVLMFQTNIEQFNDIKKECLLINNLRFGEHPLEHRLISKHKDGLFFIRNDLGEDYKLSKDASDWTLLAQRKKEYEREIEDKVPQIIELTPQQQAEYKQFQLTHDKDKFHQFLESANVARRGIETLSIDGETKYLLKFEVKNRADEFSGILAQIGITQADGSHKESKLSAGGQTENSTHHIELNQAEVELLAQNLQKFEDEKKKIEDFKKFIDDKNLGEDSIIKSPESSFKIDGVRLDKDKIESLKQQRDLNDKLDLLKQVGINPVQFDDYDDYDNKVKNYKVSFNSREEAERFSETLVDFEIKGQEGNNKYVIYDNSAQQYYVILTPENIDKMAEKAQEISRALSSKNQSQSVEENIRFLQSCGFTTTHQLDAENKNNYFLQANSQTEALEIKNNLILLGINGLKGNNDAIKPLGDKFAIILTDEKVCTLANGNKPNPSPIEVTSSTTSQLSPAKIVAGAKTQ